MSGCSDKRFRDMLYAFELGLLDGDEAHRFEMHLYECESCFEEVSRFRETARHLRHSPAVHSTIESLADRHRKPEPQRRSQRRLWSIVPIAAVALLLLILQPWHIEFHPVRESVAAETRLAVVCFQNVVDPADPQKLGETVAGLLITDLAESQYVQVVSNQRLLDILALMGHDTYRTVPPALAISVARRADARWMLCGKILQVEPVMLITSQLIDVADGDIIATQSTSGAGSDEVFVLVDDLTRQIKQDLSLPPGAFREPDRLIADVTTHSADAYRYYLDGIEAFSSMYTDEARDYFEKALSYDSSFAMVYYYLSQLRHKTDIVKAVELADKASWKEKRYIYSRQALVTHGDTATAFAELRTLLTRYPDEKEALHLLGVFSYKFKRFDDAITYFKQAIAIDPLFKKSLNMMAYSYNKSGDFEKALLAINTYISLAPGDANAYDSRAEIYLSNGYIEQAIASYKQAVQIKPDFVPSLHKLAMVEMYGRDFTAAREYLVLMADFRDRAIRQSARYLLAYIPLHQGKISEALTVVNNAVAADLMEQSSETPSLTLANKYLLQAFLHGRMNQADSAAQSLDAYRRIADTYRPITRAMLVQKRIVVYAEMGAFDEAWSALESLRDFIDDNAIADDHYWLARGIVEVFQGHSDQAVTSLTRCRGSSDSLQAQYFLARAYLDSGRYRLAADEYAALHNDFYRWQMLQPFWYETTYYYHGLALMNMGENDAAAGQLKTFLRNMKNADAGLPEVTDAIRQLKIIRNRP